MIWIWILAPAVAWVALTRARWPYPWFRAAVALWAVQAANTAYFKVRTHWLPVHVIVVLVTATVTHEAIERTRQAVAMEVYRFQLRIAAWCIPLMLAYSGFRWICPPRGDLVDKFNATVGWAWVWMFFSLGIVELLTMQKRERGVVPWLVRAHGMLLLAVLGQHAVLAWFWSAPDAVWRPMRLASHIVMTACCVGWLVLGCRRRLT